ncbi:2155_t:CDS:2, partial [Gigaspora rosea]
MLYLLVQVNKGLKCIIPECESFIRREKSEGWKEVDNGLDDISISTQDKLNAFDILMTNSKRFLLPRRYTEHNNYNRLYNEIIELFEAQQVGWVCGSHETIGKAFVNRLANALWYIDPHLSTLSALSYSLPILFTQLKTYKDVSACEHYQLKDEYIQLNDLLFEKSFYEHIEIQQYLPNDAIDRYRFIKELQLTLPIGVY